MEDTEKVSIIYPITDNDEDEEPENIADTYEFTTKTPLTIGDMMELDVEMNECLEIRGVRIPMTWTSVIKLINHQLIKGKPISKKTQVNHALKVFMKLYQQDFL